MQAQSFFAALPHSIAARLQQSPCIPTEALQWVTPKQAVVCQDPQVRALLADPRLPAVATLQYAHAGLTVLHSSQPLRALLGVGELAHSHLLDVLRKLHNSQMLAQMGMGWVAQLLLCIFDSLQQERPGSMGYQGQAPVSSATAKAVTVELKQLLLLPLTDGSFAALEDRQQQQQQHQQQQQQHQQHQQEQKQPMYFPLSEDDSEGLHASAPCFDCL